jgi:hypothetical protein
VENDESIIFNLTTSDTISFVGGNAQAIITDDDGMLTWEMLSPVKEHQLFT